MSFPGGIKLNIKPTSNFGEEARKGKARYILAFPRVNVMFA